MKRALLVAGGAALALGSLWGCSWVFFLHPGTYWTDLPAMLTGMFGIAAGSMIAIHGLDI